MAKFLVTLSVMPKTGVLDPAGVAVKNTLNDIGFPAVTGVVLGKCLHLTVTAANETAARQTALDMGRALLAHEAMEVAEVLTVKEIK